MAKFDIRFMDAIAAGSAYVKCRMIGKEKKSDNEYIEIIINDNGEVVNIWLDKSTAIKFAKTLRTEINKIES